MKRLVLYTLFACVVALFGVTEARATTYSYTCTNTMQGPTNGVTGELQLRLSSNAAWTTGGTASPKSGDTVLINSGGGATPCLGDVFVNQSGVTFENSNLAQDSSGDDINGMFEVAGAHVTLAFLNLTCSSCSPTTSNTTGLSTIDEDGALLLHDGAVVSFGSGNINASQTSGIFLVRSSAISIENALLTANGEGSGLAPQYASGIFAQGGSSVRLGFPNGTGGVTIVANGVGSNGYGVIVEGGSSLQAFVASIGTPNQNTLGQIYLIGSSSAHLQDTSVASTTASSPAIQVLGGSSVILEPNTNNAPSSINAGNGGALLLAAASTGVLNTASINSTGTGSPTIEATASSAVVLAGGNNVCSGTISSNVCTTTNGGIALQIDHSSSLIQQPATHLGYANNAADNVGGSAFVQVQSSMDIGQGTSSLLNWLVGTGNCILVQQNSSFRMSGGVAITGTAPAACTLNGGAVSTTIIIQQESNAFFNIGNGGTDNISGGGGVSCVFAGMPNAHVTGKANITPSSAQPVVVGSWTAAGTASSPACLGP